MLGPMNNNPPQKSCLRTPFNQKQKIFWVISLFMPGNIVICTFLGLKSKMAILARLTLLLAISSGVISVPSVQKWWGRYQLFFSSVYGSGVRSR